MHYEGQCNIPHIVAEPQIASDDVFEKPDGLSLYELVDHIAKHGSNGVETLVGVANICKSSLVQKDLLHNEDGDGLGKLGASFHDSETEWDDLGRQEEVDDRIVIILLQRK